MWKKLSKNIQTRRKRWVRLKNRGVTILNIRKSCSIIPLNILILLSYAKTWAKVLQDTRLSDYCIQYQSTGSWSQRPLQDNGVGREQKSAPVRRRKIWLLWGSVRVWGVVTAGRHQCQTVTSNPGEGGGAETKQRGKTTTDMEVRSVFTCSHLRT